jgi:hypothetical protein
VPAFLFKNVFHPHEVQHQRRVCLFHAGVILDFRYGHLAILQEVQDLDSLRAGKGLAKDPACNS